MCINTEQTDNDYRHRALLSDEIIGDFFFLILPFKKKKVCLSNMNDRLGRRHFRDSDSEMLRAEPCVVQRTLRDKDDHNTARQPQCVFAADKSGAKVKINLRERSCVPGTCSSCVILINGSHSPES